NGEPYTQKPPLYYWMAAAIGAPFGRVGHWPARLPSALSGIAVIGLVVFFGRRLYRNPKAGFLAGMLLLGVFRFSHQARRAQLDVVLTLCELIALMAFWSLDQKRDRSTAASRGLLLSLHGAVGIGLLTKGPVAALPYLVIVLFLLWEHRASDLRRIFPWWGPLIALAPLITWFSISSSLAPAGYLEEAATRNLWTRFFSGVHHPRPFYYFFYQLPLDFLPWTPVALVAVVAALRTAGRQVRVDPENQTRRFLLIWLGATLTFFSISAEKRGLYMLPTFPALALIGAGWLATQLNKERLPVWLSAGSTVIFIILGTAGLMEVMRLTPDIVSLDRVELPGLFLAGIVCVSFSSVAGLLWWHWYRPRVAAEIAVLLLAPILLECFLLFSLFPALDQEKSYRPVAEFVAESLPNSSPVGIYRRGSITGAIEYYSGHRTQAIESASGLSTFYRNGGRLLVAPLREKPTLQEKAGAQVIGEFRQGKRALVVVELMHTPKE
ncbi:MAG: glycosyltransferase family 39 protein, partial [Myxococcota bacterium]|nr:glycosyltransferase family 39 protein [Myxococcota bacterium]